MRESTHNEETLDRRRGRGGGVVGRRRRSAVRVAGGARGCAARPLHGGGRPARPAPGRDRRVAPVRFPLPGRRPRPGAQDRPAQTVAGRRALRHRRADRGSDPRCGGLPGRALADREPAAADGRVQLPRQPRLRRILGLGRVRAYLAGKRKHPRIERTQFGRGGAQARGFCPQGAAQRAGAAAGGVQRHGRHGRRPDRGGRAAPGEHGRSGAWLRTCGWRAWTI